LLSKIFSDPSWRWRVNHGFLLKVQSHAFYGFVWKKLTFN
jgi:hypothetical protein